MENKNSAPVGSAARLRRSLTLWDLVLYGVIVVQPVAPMSVFGVLTDRSHGYAVTTILIAMVAMLFTAISYGRMARVYPSAGSAFTYVGQEINPALGYITGWGMVMDYPLNPMICIIWCSQQAHVFAPHVAYWAWAICFAAIFTGLNIQGVKSSAHVNFGLAVAMGVVIAIFFVVAARYIFGHHGGPGYFWHPFYDPATGNTKAVLGGTSIAVLTYIGFDGISTLSEEVENPRRNILLATVLTCLVIGILSAIQVYAAQLIGRRRKPSLMSYGFRLRCRTGMAPHVYHCRVDAAGGQFRFGNGCATGRSPLAVRDGQKRGHPEGLLWQSGSETTCPAE